MGGDSKQARKKKQHRWEMFGADRIIVSGRDFFMNGKRNFESVIE
jgi:hypothetical protein